MVIREQLWYKIEKDIHSTHGFILYFIYYAIADHIQEQHDHITLYIAKTPTYMY